MRSTRQRWAANGGRPVVGGQEQAAKSKRSYWPPAIGRLVPSPRVLPTPSTGWPPTTGPLLQKSAPKSERGGRPKESLDLVCRRAARAPPLRCSRAACKQSGAGWERYPKRNDNVHTYKPCRAQPMIHRRSKHSPYQVSSGMFLHRLNEVSKIRKPRVAKQTDTNTKV